MTDPNKVHMAQNIIENQRLKPFEISVTSSDMAARHALGNILAELADLSLDAEEIATVELVLAEAINNIVEHAYPIPDCHGQIRVGCCHKKNGLHFTIKDNGRPMPDGQIPLGLAQDLGIDPMELPEGGYGWFLIKDLAKDIQYQRDEGENRLDMRIAVAIQQTRS